MGLQGSWLSLAKECVHSPEGTCSYSKGMYLIVDNSFITELFFYRYPISYFGFSFFVSMPFANSIFALKSSNLVEDIDIKFS